MSDYEYTDEDGDTVEIRPSARPAVLIQNTRASGEFASVRVPNDEAPAVALAILEAAGIDALDGGDPALAVRALRDHESRRAERAEREAEDAKVREWIDARNSQYGTIGDHWELDDATREGYRASRAFWEKHLGVREDDDTYCATEDPR